MKKLWKLGRVHSPSEFQQILSLVGANSKAKGPFVEVCYSPVFKLGNVGCRALAEVCCSAL